MFELLDVTLDRLGVLVGAPLADPHLLWAATPLLIATLFMTLYFGKYSKEELGWNTAFGNTMVFLFVSLDIVQRMYFSQGTGSWEAISSDPFYFPIAFGLMGAAGALMLITYYHLLPKKVAFFLFSAPPVNVSVYVLMTVIYSNVAADFVTLAAGFLLFVIIFIVLRGIQCLEHMASNPEGLEVMMDKGSAGLLKKLKQKNVKLSKKKEEEVKIISGGPKKAPPPQP